MTWTDRWARRPWRSRRAAGSLPPWWPAHPLYPYVAVGFQDGLTLLTSLERDPLVIPLKRSGRGAMTALAFSPGGRRLLIAGEAGDIVWLTLPEV